MKGGMHHSRPDAAGCIRSGVRGEEDKVASYKTI